MHTKFPTKNRAASFPRRSNYYFSTWSHEDCTFLSALYKEYACLQVNLMAQIMKSSPAAGRWDCSHWPLWADMARQVCSSIKKQVSPKEIEAFFWDVIAVGTGQDEVTKRLDALIFGNNPTPAILANEISRSVFDFVKSTATVEKSSKDTHEESDDDEVASDGDEAANFTVGRSRSARVSSRGSKRARSPDDQPQPVKLALNSESAEVGQAMTGSSLDVTFGSGNAKMVDLSTDFEVALVLSVTSGNSKVDDPRPQAFGQNADGGAAEHECDETGVHEQRYSTQPSVVGNGSEQARDRDRPTSVSEDANGTVVVSEPESLLTRIPGEANHVDADLLPPGVGDDGLVGGFRRSNFADSFHDYVMLPPDVQVHETTIYVDKEVQWSTGDDKEVQCEIDSTRIFDKIRKNHLLYTKIMLTQKEILKKKLGLL